jgi:hypothetical protein
VLQHGRSKGYQQAVEISFSMRTSSRSDALRAPVVAARPCRHELQPPWSAIAVANIGGHAHHAASLTNPMAPRAERPWQECNTRKNGRKCMSDIVTLRLYLNVVVTVCIIAGLSTDADAQLANH